MNNPPTDNIGMQGKVCLVTGATSGIGKVTATALAAQGAEVVILGRNPQKVKDTIQTIRSETANETTQYLLADLADLQEVRHAARAFKDRFARLDVLVNNAGAYFNRRHETPYGVELTFLVNHLAPFLLTHLLLDMLQTSAPARIVNVSSGSHLHGAMDFDNLGFRRGYFGMKAYACSKLANVLFTYELARRLQGSGVTANALDPGTVVTDIWRTNFSIIGPALKWFIGRIALSPEEGADTSIYLATSPEVEGVTGQYFAKRKAVPSSPLSYDQNTALRLWQESEKLTGLA